MNGKNGWKSWAERRACGCWGFTCRRHSADCTFLRLAGKADRKMQRNAVLVQDEVETRLARVLFANRGSRAGGSPRWRTAATACAGC